MSVQNLPDMEHLPKDIDLIILSGRIGIIANTVSKKLEIDGMRALELFYVSDTCRRLHDKKTGLYLFGDLYIVDELLLEMQAKSY